LKKAAFAAFFICGDNAVPAQGISKNSEFAKMQSAEKICEHPLCGLPA
jgi:hypothetical protein